MQYNLTTVSDNKPYRQTNAIEINVGHGFCFWTGRVRTHAFWIIGPVCAFVCCWPRSLSRCPDAACVCLLLASVLKPMPRCRRRFFLFMGLSCQSLCSDVAGVCLLLASVPKPMPRCRETRKRTTHTRIDREVVSEQAAPRPESLWLFGFCFIPHVSNSRVTPGRAKALCSGPATRVAEETRKLCVWESQ